MSEQGVKLAGGGQGLAYIVELDGGTVAPIRG